MSDSEQRVHIGIWMDHEADYYKDLISPLRGSNQLTKFVLDLIRAYYEEPVIQQLYADYVDRNDPLSVIKRQIAEAQENHEKTIMATRMLSSHVDASEEAIQSANAGISSPQLPAGGSKLEERLNTIEQVLPEITGQLGVLIQALQAGGAFTLPVGQPQTPVAPPTQSSQDQGQSVSSASVLPVTAPVVPAVSAEVPPVPAPEPQSVPVVVPAPVASPAVDVPPVAPAGVSVGVTEVPASQVPSEPVEQAAPIVAPVVAPAPVAVPVSPPAPVSVPAVAQQVDVPTVSAEVQPEVKATSSPPGFAKMKKSITG